MAKPRKLAVITAAAVADEDDDAPDCPKCPPKGAPAWMATFADIATLLMAFFVLILSFAEFDQPRFRMLAGALREQFGVQSVVPSFDLPRGTTVMSTQFSPSPDPSVLPQITQQTTDTQRPQAETRTRADAEVAREAQAMAEALNAALEGTGVSASADGGTVTLDIPETDSAEDLTETLQAASQALAQVEAARAQSGAADAPIPEVVVAGLAGRLSELGPQQPQTPSDGGASDAGGPAGRQAGMASSQLQVALREEIANGLVAVEQRDDQVFITVGAGGAFASGSADLTVEAREIMARIAYTALGPASRITVIGHTDDVPLGAGAALGDNWGLAAARAASVVREFGASGQVDPANLLAQSRGETAPVAPNTTAEGRARNRRVEIEITY